MGTSDANVYVGWVPYEYYASNAYRLAFYRTVADMLGQPVYADCLLALARARGSCPPEHSAACKYALGLSKVIGWPYA